MELESRAGGGGERDGIGDGSKGSLEGERETATLHRIGRAVEGSRGWNAANDNNDDRSPR